MTTYVRQWWSSRNGATREKDLYRSLKADVQSSSQAIDTLQELQLSAPLFAATLNSEHDVWKSYPHGRAAIEALLRFGVEQYRPLLLSALRHFEPEELDKLLLGLVTWSARGLIVGGIGGGTTERAYAEAAVRISSGRKPRTAEAVLDELGTLVPGDREFRNVFATRTVARVRLARYYLTSLENSLAGQSKPYLVSEVDERKFTSVPVVPLTDPDGLWDNMLDVEKRKSIHNRLGNLVLRETDEGDLPRNPLERVQVLGGVNSPRAIKPGAHFLWDAEQVDERQEALAEIAVRTWPRRPWAEAATETP